MTLVQNQAETSSAWTIGQCAAFACLLEATAPKPGNVHRGADFEDVTYPEFIASGIAIAPELDQACQRPLGQTIIRCVKATQRVASGNTNLGMILLLAPLAAVPREQPLTSGVAKVLGQLSPEDARDVYEAIRLAQPGGLGTVSEADIAGKPPADLLAAMRLGAEHDMVARQYAENFFQVFEYVVPWLSEGLNSGRLPLEAIVTTQLRLMSQFPDSLIARKCGLPVAKQSAAWAANVLESGLPDSETYLQALADFDFWLRSDGHRRNPGTTADLVCAGLFVLLREGIMQGPLHSRP